MSEAPTLADALREAATQPDWILLDLMLPDGCGTELLRRVRAGSVSSKVCVITGCGAAKLAEVRALKPDHVFSKPVNVEGLLLALAH